MNFKTVFQVGSIQEQSSWFGNDPMTTVQCFPFYSILLAFGRTQVDFFSLDVEGHELKVLKTIPWNKIDIKVCQNSYLYSGEILTIFLNQIKKTIAVEWEHVEEGDQAIIDFMEGNGFVNFGKIATPYARDIIFVKDFLRFELTTKK